MDTGNKRSVNSKSRSKFADKIQQDKPLTLDEGLEAISNRLPQRKATERKNLLTSIKMIDFHMEQTANKMFEISFQLVISTKALVFITSSVVGVVVLAIKLLAD